jgi:poly(3-hydroxybutyrate) depolymerase
MLEHAYLTVWLLIVYLALAATNSHAQGTFPQGPFEVERVDLGDQETGRFPAYYLAVPVEDARGVLILLPGLNGDTALALRETSLPFVAAARGIATVIVPTRFVLAVDDSTRAFIDGAVRDAAERYGLPLDRTAIGGFSAGGILALGYTVEAHARPGSTAVSPRAVFSVDAPVDLAEAYATFERTVERDCSEVGVYEARFVLDLMHSDFGTPTEDAETYERYSPYSNASPDGGNAKHLTDLPVRLYHDPAINWQIANRCRSLYDNNVTGASALINALRMAGNDQAELILAEGRGASGERRASPAYVGAGGGGRRGQLDASGVRVNPSGRYDLPLYADEGRHRVRLSRTSSIP